MTLDQGDNKLASVGRGYVTAASERAEIAAIFALVEHIRANRRYCCIAYLEVECVSCSRSRRQSYFNCLHDSI